VERFATPRDGATLLLRREALGTPVRGCNLAAAFLTVVDPVV
jgi:hypothetical protein